MSALLPFLRRCVMVAAATSIAAIACGGGAFPDAAAPRAPTPAVRRARKLEISVDYEARVVRLSERARLGDLAICDGGLPVVAVATGLHVGDRVVLPPPEARATESVACDWQGDVFVVAGGRVVALDRASKYASATAISDVPAGKFHLTATPHGMLWMWGEDAAGGSRIVRYDHGIGSDVVYSGTAPVAAVDAVGDNGLVAVIGGELRLFDGETLRRVANLFGTVHGVTFAGGSIFVSVDDRILRLGPAGDAPEVVAEGVHGVLRAHRDRVYVLPPAADAVLVLEPKETRR